MKNTYLLLHPSSVIIVEQIFNCIKEKGFIIEDIYRINQWDEILDSIYQTTYSKSETVKMHVHAHAYLNKYFYGNCGLLVILHKEVDYKTMVRDTLELKQTIRSYMDDTRNGTISIMLNVNKVKLCNGMETLHDSIEKKENVFFSYVHCPDSEEQYREDFKIFNNYNIKKLDENEVKMMLKFHSYYWS